ncbi:MAG TPA: hypothetical protein VFG14_03440, partial [Chthoniobacteraceae bacterium]|nr:hypothetical protein [Chthoniobacteraceae bacterium]
MKYGSLSFRTLLIAVGALLLGWGLGYLTGRPGEQGSGGGWRGGSGSGLSGLGDSSSGPGSELKDTAGDSAIFTPVNASASPAAQIEGLIRGALRLTDNTDRIIRLREIARWISRENLPDAVEKARKLSYSDRWQVMQALGTRWAEIDPLGAAEYANKQGGNRYGWNDLLNGIIDKWVTLDQQAALTWIKNQPEGRRLNLMQSMIQSMARRDPENALQVIQSVPGTKQMNWLNQEIFEQWSQRDPAGAARAAEGMEMGPSRERALQSIAGSWAMQDPAAAIKWTESFTDKATQNKLLRSVAQSWAETDPNAVIQWAASITEANVRQEILGAAYSKAAQSNLDGVKAQLRALPSGQEKDNLVNQVANAMANQDAKSALAMLDLLPAGPTRTSTAANLAMRLAASDPKAASEVFLSLPIGQLTYQVEQFASNLATG